MTEFKINENGVPSLSANDIEKKVEEVIEFFNPDILCVPCETPLLSFIEETAEKYDFSYDLSQDLGNNAHGHKILGKFRFKPRAIFADKSIDGDLRQKFVIGHEFGHLVLHRNLLIKRESYADVDIADSEKDFVTGKKILLTPRDWLEWQANRFSSAILMPRRTLLSALVSVQKSLDIHRNIGQIYLDDQAYSFSDFQQTMDGLQNIYQVTKYRIALIDSEFLFEFFGCVGPSDRFCRLVLAPYKLHDRFCQLR
ncbi:MAG: ImmA/IrrE family metallo-endopeptidase, partial [Chloroflexota bacterium]